MSDPSDIIRRAREVGILELEDIDECRDGLIASDLSTEQLLKALTGQGKLTQLQLNKLKKGDKSGYFYGANKVLYKVASGGFARVYRATNVQTGETTAIKVLRKRWTTDVASVQAFQHEGKVGAMLRHPNIVRIDEVGQSRDEDHGDPIHFITMEFVEGGNLKNFLGIRQGKVNAEEGVRLMLDSLKGLNYAFDKGIAHRDIKLTNILAGATGRLKLVDFGLATVHRNEKLAEEAHGQRTVEYAQLEKSTGAAKGDPRSDIFFLGAVFYQMLSGIAPFPERKSRTARMLRTRVDLAKPLREVDPKMDRRLSAIVDRCMALNPNQRFQTPHDVIAELLQYSGMAPDLGEIAEEAPAEVIAPPKNTNSTVLFLERNSTLQNNVRKKLSALGYRVLITTDPNRAMSMYSNNEIGCVIVDCENTGRQGLQALYEMERIARQTGKGWGGIAIFAKEQKELADRMETSDRTRTLVKPATIRDLRKQVQQLLPIANNHKSS